MLVPKYAEEGPESTQHTVLKGCVREKAMSKTNT